MSKFRWNANAHIEAYILHTHERSLAANFAKVIREPNFAYAKIEYAGGSPYMIAYARRSDSPSSVLRVGSCLDLSEAWKILNDAGIHTARKD